MKAFADLFTRLDATTRTAEKVGAMASYFDVADPADAAWAVHFLGGDRPRRLVPVRKLAGWAMERSRVPPWLFDECYQAVGDLAETIALLLPPSPSAGDLPLHVWVERRLLAMSGQSEDVQRQIVLAAWDELGDTERFLWNKLITGGFRVGVSKALVVRALASWSGVDEPTIAHRLMGGWEPSADSFERLVATGTADADVSRPYPFLLAYPLEGEVEALGASDGWQAEWKWDGIRAQVVRRQGRTFVWTRGEELATERFPELAESAALLPDGTVLDGEIMAWRGEEPLPFATLQRRIGRKKLSPKILAEVPVVLVAYDLLELHGEDIRPRPLSERRSALENLLGEAPAVLRLSPCLEPNHWDGLREARAAARERGAEGLMLKRLDAPYAVGRRRGIWWKWKVDPFSVDAVMLYAQPGSGRRASLFTDYTFGVRDGDALVPFAKAYSGLTDAEIRQLDRWIRRHTLEKFGPVRAVEPVQIFEIAFEGIRHSSRHRSGLAVRFPRIVRWRRDKEPGEVDTLDTLRALAEAG